MNLPHTALLATALFLSSLPVAYADEFEDGRAAYDRGDFKTAMELWRPLAEKGNTKAINNIGLLYANGQGVSADSEEALDLFTEAAEQGNSAAQRNLGLIYQNGQGVERDPVVASMWYNIGSASGDTRASRQGRRLKASMNIAQRLESERLAYEWMVKNYSAAKVNKIYWSRRRR
jgi:TPR repeat protein